MNWDFLPANEGYDAASPDWDALNARLHAGHPMLDSRFVGALLRHFPQRGSLLCRRLKGGEVTAMALLRRRMPGVWCTYMPSQTQIAPLLLPDTASGTELLYGLPGYGVSLDLLSQDPSYSPYRPETSGATFTPHNLTMGVSLDAGFDAYWTARATGLRQNLRRYRRRAEAFPLLPRLAVLDTDVAMSPALARYGEIESRGWKGKQGTAIHAGNAQGRFYGEVMNSYARTGQAAIFELWLGDRLAASRLTVHNRNLLVMLKTTYDESLSEYAPGRLLLYELLQYLDQSALPKRVEFYTNATPDQLAWATDSRWINHVSLHRNRLARNAIAAASRLKARIKRQLRNH